MFIPILFITCSTFCIQTRFPRYPPALNSFRLSGYNPCWILCHQLSTFSHASKQWYEIAVWMPPFDSLFRDDTKCNLPCEESIWEGLRSIISSHLWLQALDITFRLGRDRRTPASERPMLSPSFCPSDVSKILALQRIPLIVDITSYSNNEPGQIRNQSIADDAPWVIS